MKKVGLVYDEIFLRHEPPVWHPDSPERLVSVISALKATGVWPKLLQLKTRKAGLEDLERVHTRAHIERVRDHQAGELDPDTYCSENSYEAAVHAAGRSWN